MAKNSYTDKDHGFNKLVTTFRVAPKESAVFIGYNRSSGEYKPKTDEKAQAPITMAQLAAIHEYGAEIKNGFGRGVKFSIPQRSFMDSTMTDDKNKIQKTVDKVAKKIIDGKFTVEKALGVIGEYVKGRFQNKIRSGLSPSLKHRSGKPLWDTGQLINTMDWEVKKGGK